MLPLHGQQVASLVRELKTLHATQYRQKKKEKNVFQRKARKEGEGVGHLECTRLDSDYTSRKGSNSSCQTLYSSVQKEGGEV